MISYSGLVNYGKATLPSVESWGTNANIIRDPPRSVMTRKKEMVGDTSRIAATLAESDDRFCENINYYARGQNPMVSVSYGEAGNNQSTGGMGTGTQPYLPYRVARDGAFRPPVWRQEDLLPLSRLPRNLTSVYAKKCNVDFTRRIKDCGGKEGTRDVALKSCATNPSSSNETDDKCTPIMTFMLKDPLAVGIEAPNKRYTKAFFDQNLDTSCRTVENKLNASARTNPCNPSFEPITVERTPLLLKETRPNAQGYTNACGPKYAVDVDSYDYVLPDKPRCGGFDAKPSIPPIFNASEHTGEYKFLKPQRIRV